MDGIALVPVDAGFRSGATGFPQDTGAAPKALLTDDTDRNKAQLRDNPTSSPFGYETDRRDTRDPISWSGTRWARGAVVDMRSPTRGPEIGSHSGDQRPTHRQSRW